jgi:hypothetical protein
MAWKEAQKQQLSKVEQEEFQRILRAKLEADELERRQVSRLEPVPPSLATAHLGCWG